MVQWTRIYSNCISVVKVDLQLAEIASVILSILDASETNYHKLTTQIRNKVGGGLED
jgi:hypothetical protein